VAGSAALPALTVLHGEASRLAAVGAALATRTPPPWAALLLGVGILYMLHGARNRYALAVPGGAVLGLAAARLLVLALNGPGAPVQPEILWVSAGMVALACAGWPTIFPVAAAAIPGLAVGWLLPIAGRAWLGAAAGALGMGLLGALAREWVASLAAGGLGAAAAIVGALGLLARSPIGLALAAHPVALLAIWAVLTVAGAAFHAGRAWPSGSGRGGEPAPFQPDRPVHEGAEYDAWRG
jgi:hypothetical protein